MSGQIARLVRISGRVQGVFFRDSLRQAAEAQAVRGWVRNEADGAVVALLEGEADPVEQVLEFCRTGPPRAQVQDVEVRPADPVGMSGFEIR